MECQMSKFMNHNFKMGKNERWIRIIGFVDNIII